ncbi:hypothetical protein SAMN04487762_2202 [Polaribacter sp. Hel1_33_78]|jgi:hypothetical protein|uniref:hypothetical protein n=1 Tax=Polaribacter sp. Hel1_33_78 TaxID=1336804 RepID=UPI00087B55A1|nr:hypothetical protein [Polaribacter sp. Hel1_33_78]MBT3741874.1 hypothetical protein [Polaribacter sp.]MBT7816633.1 hypothetical protein [Polaribacter sp.]MDG1194335.1 hypothetical protein [Polaribacter sp.]SDU16573.1 hypothetical protein SAMN04487762_2202 [Polaribacter sp. Hel1_33_78]
MLIEKKENYKLIYSDENSFSKFYSSFLKKEKEFDKENLIVQISNEINITKEDFLLFLSIAKQKKENSTSLVIVYKDINIDDFPEDFNIVPTLVEAEDIIEMEAIERELGF